MMNEATKAICYDGVNAAFSAGVGRLTGTNSRGVLGGKDMN